MSTDDRTGAALDALCAELDDGRPVPPALLATALRALHERVAGVAVDGSALHARVTTLEASAPAAGDVHDVDQADATAPAATTTPARAGKKG